MPEATGHGVLAADLDGTVIRVNSFPAFVRFLARELLVRGRIGALLRLVTAGIRRRLGRTDHGHLKRVVCEVGASVPRVALQRWAARLLAQHGNREVIELIRAWPGPRLLTTAAPEVYAVTIADLLEVAETHGSRMVEGVLVDNTGDAKRVRFEESGLASISLFLTDDLVLDAPMAGIADRVLEVSSDGRMTDRAGEQHRRS